nr:MAG TPA: hypothetical protein [Caudoviricetes sp.]
MPRMQLGFNCIVKTPFKYHGHGGALCVKNRGKCRFMQMEFTTGMR